MTQNCPKRNHEINETYGLLLSKSKTKNISTANILFDPASAVLMETVYCDNN